MASAAAGAWWRRATLKRPSTSGAKSISNTLSIMSWLGSSWPRCACWTRRSLAPVQVLAGASRTGCEFAAAHAEVVFTAQPELAGAQVLS